jgi:hypothetical protein
VNKSSLHGRDGRLQRRSLAGGRAPCGETGNGIRENGKQENGNTGKQENRKTARQQDGKSEKSGFFL